MKFFHVAHSSYETGDDLLCAEALETERGIVHAWKWEDAPDWIDRDVVCLFRDRAEAEEFVVLFAPDGLLLEITLPDDHDLRMTTVEEGYDAVAGMIPAEYIAVAS